MPTILDIINKTTAFFESKGIDNAKYDAQHLIAFGLGLNRMDLYLKFDQPLTEQELQTLRPLVVQRGARTPLQHIVGTTGFRNLTLACDSRALIPRPDTEGIVDLISRFCINKSALSIIDIGVGTGAIILSVAQEIPGHSYTGTDISLDALTLAQENFAHNSLDSTISFVHSDLWEHFEAGRDLFDIIVSNPPYIESSIILELEPEVRSFDPALALDGGATGLDWYQRFFNESLPYTKDGSIIILEIGFDQKAALTKIISAFTAYTLLEVVKDYSGNDRFVVVGVKK